MPIYHSLGKTPNKRHTQFYKPDGSLYHEELFGTIGFEGMSSLLYHEHAPTQIKKINKSIDITPKIAIEKNVRDLNIVSDAFDGNRVSDCSINFEFLCISQIRNLNVFL